jgi:hypothetical protein
VLSAPAIALFATALIAGVTGAWSPCGFSMVETLGAASARGLRRTTGIACATFAVGAMAGGAITFGGLAWLGSLLGGAQTAAAVAIAALAAVCEALGVRIVPQIRRQVPEPWRRGMPLPLAAALYGVLLGLGFTTFVLTWAVWALAGIAVALGDPAIGAAVGVTFGIGRALPVLAMAPSAAEGRGARMLAAMAERPASLRLLRLGDALGLALAAVLLASGPALAATVLDGAGGDPSAAGDDIAWQHSGAGGVLLRGGVETRLPGTDPAIGGGLVAWRNGDLVTVAQRATLAPLFQVSIPGVDKLAISDRWLVDRRRTAGSDELQVRPIAAPAAARQVLLARSPSQIGRPSIDGNRVAFGVARGRGTKIVVVDVARRRRRVVRSGERTQFLEPSLLGGRMLYVAVTRCRQELRVARPGRDRVLLRLRPLAGEDRGHDEGHTSQGSRTPCPGGARPPGTGVLWSTALAATRAVVTVLRVGGAGGASRPSLLSIRR